VVTAVVSLDDRFDLDDDPQVVLIGIPSRDDDGETFREALVDEVAGAVESIPRHRRRDRDVVSQAARRAIRAHMAQRWGKKPVTHVFVVTAG
jgi:ribonuclease J